MRIHEGSTVRSTFFRRGVLALAVGAYGCTAGQASDDEPTSSGVREPMVLATSLEASGRYLIQIGGCNDCHTDGYLETNGDVPESRWLTGSALGFRGPWGTSYPPNLRRTVESMSEEQFVSMLATRVGLPPMPWPSVNNMSDADRRSIYRYIRSLEPTGEVSPVALPPGLEPTGPWIDFVPRGLGAPAVDDGASEPAR